MSLEQILQKGVYKSKAYLKRNSSTILTCVGAIGVVATSVIAVKATPKALVLLEQAENEKGEELTRLEVVKVAAPAYIPTAIIGASTVACIFGANALNKRQQAVITSAYVLVNNAYKEYKNKLKELYGEEAHQNIVNSIAIEKTKDVNISSEYMGVMCCDLSIEENDSEPRLFYDEYSGRYFEKTIEQVINAEYHLNRNYVLRGYSTLNEFYNFLGLEETQYGYILGWTPTDEGTFWIDFNHRKVVLDDGLECYVIEMPFEPNMESLEDWL